LSTSNTHKKGKIPKQLAKNKLKTRLIHLSFYLATQQNTILKKLLIHRF